jgi:HD superfamily phosphodiesterase
MRHLVEGRGDRHAGGMHQGIAERGQGVRRARGLALGTVDWGHARNGGRLDLAERWAMTAQGVAAVLRNRVAPRRAAAAAIAPDVARTTTAPARRAEMLLAETSPPWLVNHGFRTYAWALALAARDDLRPDRELLYGASLLHDLGITERFMPDAGACFALSGADAAEAELIVAGLEPARARVVADAISLHLNVVVALRTHGTEAHLVRAATALDVIGADARTLPRAFRDRTLAELPRLAFKREVATAIEHQARRSPASRIGHLCRTLGFVGRVHAAPFAE